MKRVKKPKPDRMRISARELEHLKRDVTKSAVEKSCLLVLAAATDELSLTEDQLCAIMVRTDRYANYIDDHIVRLKDMQKSIEKNTGIKLRGWI